MIGGLIILIITGILSFIMIDRIHRSHPLVDRGLMRNLYFFHILLSLAYYMYVLFSPSDSKFYYQKILMNFRGDSWFSFYGSSTTFIEFVGYPFIKFMGFSYEAIMTLFSFFGFMGFLYFYAFFKENIKFKHEFYGYDLLTLIFFLPNLHFWSASFGKGALIFFGIGLFFYGIGNIKKRFIEIALGALIIYHVRPHVMLVILVSTAIGFVFSTAGINRSVRILFLIVSTMAFFFIYRDVLSLVGISENETIGQGLNLSHRAKELSGATSGIDISNYSLPMQVFTFLYRPLFFDAPGLLGIIVSFENVFYLLITLKMVLGLKGVKYLISAPFQVKSAFLSFITVSIALAQVSGNLGLAIRQKSQVMILFMFVIISFLDAQRYEIWKSKARRAQRNKSPLTRPDVMTAP
jgi:hypothetical protein